MASVLSHRLHLHLHLHRLRRSTRLAVFMLLVFVLRVGIVTACTPDDLAELTADHDAAALSVDAHGGDPAHDASDGHCLHCACHLAIALPAAMQGVPGLALSVVPAALSPPRADARPERELRPPIP